MEVELFGRRHGGMCEFYLGSDVWMDAGCSFIAFAEDVGHDYRTSWCKTSALWSDVFALKVQTTDIQLLYSIWEWVSFALGFYHAAIELN